MNDSEQNRGSSRLNRSTYSLFVSFFVKFIIIVEATTQNLPFNLQPAYSKSIKSETFINCIVQTRGGTMSHGKVAEMIEGNDEPGKGDCVRSETPPTDRNEKENIVGGGEINEKTRLFKNSKNKKTISTDQNHSSEINKNEQLSHTLHALVGLNRYPNYLSRWPVENIDDLEKSLEKNLALIRKQKENIMIRRAGIAKMIQKISSDKNIKEEVDLSILNVPTTWQEVKDKILHPQASEAIFQSRMFKAMKRKKVSTPTIQSVISGTTTVELDPGELEEWLDQEMFDVYSFPLLSKKFCTEVKKFIRKIVSLGETSEYVSLNIGKRIVDLDTIGLSWLNDLIFHLIIRPISQHLFWDTESMGDLDWRQGYVAGYSSQPSADKGAQRERLVSHTDDSEVTFNLCLGDEMFDGGLLNFRGLRGTEEEGQLVGEFQPILGTALLHAGRHLHEVTQVTAGNRYAYIIWTRSWKGVRSETCPCCWMNRRQGLRCICGKAWN